MSRICLCRFIMSRMFSRPACGQVCAWMNDVYFKRESYSLMLRLYVLIWFLTRDARHIARTMLSLDIRPSVTRRDSVETVIHVIKLFPTSGSHTTLVFLHQTVWQYSDGYLPNGGEWKGAWTRGQSNLTKSASRGAHSPVRGHPRGSKVVPLNSWGRVSY